MLVLPEGAVRLTPELQSHVPAGMMNSVVDAVTVAHALVTSAALQVAAVTWFVEVAEKELNPKLALSPTAPLLKKPTPGVPVPMLESVAVVLTICVPL